MITSGVHLPACVKSKVGVSENKPWRLGAYSLLITSTQISSIHPQYAPSLRTRIVIISRHVRSRGVDELKMLLLMPQKFNIPTLKIRCLLETFG